MAEKKKKVSILEIRKIKTKNGDKLTVNFSKGVTIQFQGKDVDLGEYGSCFVKSPEEMKKDLDFLVEKEYITEDEKEKRLTRLEEKNVKGSVTVPLA